VGVASATGAGSAVGFDVSTTGACRGITLPSADTGQERYATHARRQSPLSIVPRIRIAVASAFFYLFDDSKFRSDLENRTRRGRKLALPAACLLSRRRIRAIVT
jgi:hypothetical protein